MSDRLCVMRLMPLGSFALAVLLAASSTRGSAESAGMAVCISIAPPSNTYTADAGKDSVQVTATDPACPWQVGSDVPWIVITSPAGGTGKGSAPFTFDVQSNAGAPNVNTAPRSGTVTVTDLTPPTSALTFTANQHGCFFSTASNTANVPASAGSYSVQVLTGSAMACPWTAASNVSWITVTTQGGSGDGTAGYTVAANPGSVPRSGNISVAGQTFTVNQAAAQGPCSYQLSPASRSVGPQSTTGNITVTAPDGCNWTANSTANWITITSGGTGAGSGIVNYSASANTSSATRLGTITLADQTFTLTQSGAGACSYSLSPTGAGYPPAGGAGIFGIAAPDGCTWTPNSNATWITIASGGSGGSGTGQIGYAVASNPGPDAREGAVTIAGLTFTVHQAAPGDQADLSVAVTAGSNPVAAGTRLSYTIVVRNAGPNAATGVTLATATPNGTTFASLTGPGSSTTPALGQAGPISSFIGSIPSAGSASFTVDVNVIGAPGSSLLENTAVSSLTPDPVPGNNSAAVTTQILGGGIVELSWDQAPSTAANPTPAPTNLRAGPAPSASASELSPRIAVTPASDDCAVTGYNVYLSTSMPVQTVPANLWLALPPTSSTQAPVAPAGTFYVVTTLWNCGGTIIEAGLTGSGGSNQTGVAAPPNIAGVRVGGKLRVTGAGFGDAVDVFLDGAAFTRPAGLKNDNTLVVQKGPLVDGRLLSDVFLPGKTVLISVRNSNGGIGAFSYTQQ